MAKGKTNQPLQFIVPIEWLDTPLFQDLMGKGHSVEAMPVWCTKADVVFGLNCHILTENMMLQKGIIDVALRVARKRKKEKK
jgi:hypothetical protein